MIKQLVVILAFGCFVVSGVSAAKSEVFSACVDNTAFDQFQGNPFNYDDVYCIEKSKPVFCKDVQGVIKEFELPARLQKFAGSATATYVLCRKGTAHIEAESCCCARTSEMTGIYSCKVGD